MILRAKRGLSMLLAWTVHPPGRSEYYQIFYNEVMESFDMVLSGSFAALLQASVFPASLVPFRPRHGTSSKPQLTGS